MNHFKELRVWQKAVDLAVEVYMLTKKFLIDERYSLIPQINRSVVAISSNIAEGAGINTQKDFHHFLGIALGSSYELETQMLIACKVHFLTTNEFEVFSKNIQDIQRMIFALQKTLFSTKDQRQNTKDS